MSIDGTALPSIRTEVPGPRSRDLSQRLARVESPNITRLRPPPIFWQEARGANVVDADGNVYLDLSAGFGVATAGHANAAVVQAIATQADRLCHALGDVYPADVKVELLEKLAAIAPGDLQVAILGSAGAEAVEAAFKTAFLHTGRPGILAFEHGYHGLTYGALSATWRRDFREPFLPQLIECVTFAPFPVTDDAVVPSLSFVSDAIERAEATHYPIGAVLVEPIQGRGGINVPPPGFLEGLRAICDAERVLLIADEVYTGIGRTGRWFACEHAGVVPDLLLLGKGLTGSLPLSAVIGAPEVMAAWPESTGEAIHTSTFLGNPIACAAALAQLEFIETHDLLARASALGSRIQDRARAWQTKFAFVGPARGRGALQGIPLEPLGNGQSRAIAVCDRALEAGVIVLAEGDRADVLAITPPVVITDRQLEHALNAVEAALHETA